MPAIWNTESMTANCSLLNQISIMTAVLYWPWQWQADGDVQYNFCYCTVRLVKQHNNLCYIFTEWFDISLLVSPDKSSFCHALYGLKNSWQRLSPARRQVLNCDTWRFFIYSSNALFDSNRLMLICCIFIFWFHVTDMFQHASIRPSDNDCTSSGSVSTLKFALTVM